MRMKRTSSSSRMPFFCSAADLNPEFAFRVSSRCSNPAGGLELLLDLLLERTLLLPKSGCGARSLAQLTFLTSNDASVARISFRGLEELEAA
jgi:hypothetical protein